MNLFQTLFTVFFAICWGTSSNVWARWKPFNWPLLCHAPTCWRILLSMLFLNVIPIGYFAGILVLLDVASEEKPHGVLLWCRAVWEGVVPAFGMFGIYRVWVAIIEAWGRYFYFRSSSDMPRFLQDPGNKRKNTIEPSLEELGIDVPIPRWWINVVVGIAYVGIGVVAALCARI